MSITAAAADAIGALRAVEIDALDDDELDTLVAEVAALRSAVDCVWLRVVAAVERRGLHRRHQARDTSTWLAGLAGERVGTVRREVELADILAAAPAVAAAVDHHTLSTAKAAELGRAAALPDAVIDELAAAASRQSVTELAAAVRQARLDHDLPEPAAAASCQLVRHHDRVRLDATVDLVDGELVDVALDTFIATAKVPTDRSSAERRAAALVGLARFYLDHCAEPASTRVGRPHLLVLVDLAVLEARTGGTARLASGAVISGDIARQLASDADITRIVTKGASQVLDVGRTTRTIPPAIAKAVIARDRHCRYAGCTSPASNCDIHHRQPWATGGATSLDNLGLLCWHHHHNVVHAGDPGRLHEHADGTWTVGQPPRPREEAA